MTESLGHVLFAEGPSCVWEYLHAPDGSLYRAPAAAPIDSRGYRQGARFECMPRPDGHAAYFAAYGIEDTRAA